MAIWIVRDGFPAACSFEPEIFCGLGDVHAKSLLRVTQTNKDPLHQVWFGADLFVYVDLFVYG